jgi:hypothetical protein
MVHGTFVLSGYSKKGEEATRIANYRRTNMRYVVVVIAIFVVFGCEYCFDNASVLIEGDRPYRYPSRKI